MIFIAKLWNWNWYSLKFWREQRKKNHGGILKVALNAHRIASVILADYLSWNIVLLGLRSTHTTCLRVCVYVYAFFYCIAFFGHTRSWNSANNTGMPPYHFVYFLQINRLFIFFLSSFACHSQRCGFAYEKRFGVERCAISRSH